MVRLPRGSPYIWGATGRPFPRCPPTLPLRARAQQRATPRNRLPPFTQKPQGCPLLISRANAFAHLVSVRYRFPFSPLPIGATFPIGDLSPSNRTPNHVSAHPLPGHHCRPRPRRSPPPLARRSPPFAACKPGERGRLVLSALVPLP
jgi:hypothetical protein